MSFSVQQKVRLLRQQGRPTKRAVPALRFGGLGPLRPLHPVGYFAGMISQTQSVGRLGLDERRCTMKYINYILILLAVSLAFIGLYYWLAKGQIDYAAFYFAISTSMHSVYLHSTKSNKAG